MKTHKIFKVQRPLMTTEKEPKLFIYDKDRKYETFIPMRLAKDILKMMGNQSKKFFDGEIEDGKVLINSTAPEQDW